MIFSIIILVLIAAIAFFHYVQGFFSATISAVLAVLAAVLAVSYHEPLAELLLPANGRFADQAYAASLVVIFAAAYLVPRVIIDKLIPGNVRLPVIADKIGAAVMGIVAGVFATGVVALAGQTLPLGPSIAMHSRYLVGGERLGIVVPGPRGQNLDAVAWGELRTQEPGELAAADVSGLWIPVDDIVVGTVEHLSDGGSLAGPRSMTSVHPDYLQELFGSRLGIQPGGRITAANLKGGEQVKLQGLWMLDRIAQKDAELPGLRNLKLENEARSDADEILLVARVLVTKEAAGDDMLFRFSPTSVRLVAGNPAEGIPYRNYYPIGTLENANTLYVNAPDDSLFMNLKDADRAVDLVFRVDRDALAGGAVSADPRAVPRIGEGTFLEVKRMARIDLGGEDVARGIKADPNVGVMRKTAVAGPGSQPAQPKPDNTANANANANTNSTPGGTEKSTDAPVQNVSIATGARLFTKIDVGTPDANIEDHAITSGRVSLKDRKISELEVHPVYLMSRLARGQHALDELWVPEGQVLVQVYVEPKGGPWAWADPIAQIQLVDESGETYKPIGAWAKVHDEEGTKIFAHYEPTGEIKWLPSTSDKTSDVTIAYLVPSGTQLKSLNFNGKVVQELDQIAQ